MKESKKKIGIFDSGLGGLIIAKAIREKMPEYDYIYLGDTKRVPYGNRSHEAVYEFTCQAVDYLIKKENCAIVILACNTSSARALRRVQQEYLPKYYKNKKFLLSTLILWVIYFLMGYVIFFSLEETSSLAISSGIAVLVAGSLGMVVPVNAGIGAYHFLVASILISYNINYETGLFFATILHTSQIICLALLGIVSSLILFFKIRSHG